MLRTKNTFFLRILNDSASKFMHYLFYLLACHPTVFALNSLRRNQAKKAEVLRKGVFDLNLCTLVKESLRLKNNLSIVLVVRHFFGFIHYFSGIYKKTNFFRQKTLKNTVFIFKFRKLLKIIKITLKVNILMKNVL